MFCNARLARWIINGFCLLAAAGFLALLLLNSVNTRWPALQCSGSELLAEPRISHKFGGDTVKNWMLLVSTILLPPMQILLVERISNRAGAVDVDHNELGWYRRCSASTPSSGGSLKTSLKWVGDYLFGLLFTLIITDIGKSTVNAPRPHFIDSCQPTFEAADCVMSWVEKYSCRNPYRLGSIEYQDIHKSFPSGHSSCGMYMAVFVVLYLHHRLDVRRLGSVALLTLHTVWFGWGLFCGLSRVMDNRHHPIDVAVGFLIGGSVAVFCVIALTRRFRRRSRSPPAGESEKGPEGTELQAYVV